MNFDAIAVETERRKICFDWNFNSRIVTGFVEHVKLIDKKYLIPDSKPYLRFHTKSDYEQNDIVVMQPFREKPEDGLTYFGYDEKSKTIYLILPII